MKKTMILMFVSLIGLAAFSQSAEKKAIEKVITEFAKAADQNNVEQLASFLDENYRIVMNQLFGSDALAITSRTDYLAKIESKEWGGDNRILTFHEITINGQTASAHVTLRGEKATFVSIFMLVKNAEGNWKLVSDMPTIEG